MNRAESLESSEEEKRIRVTKTQKNTLYYYCLQKSFIICPQTPKHLKEGYLRRQKKYRMVILEIFSNMLTLLLSETAMLNLSQVSLKSLLFVCPLSLYPLFTTPVRY
jgi:hypothetical protein